LKAIRFKSLPVRLVCILFAVVVTYFSVKVFLWCFASSASINASVKEVGDLLVSISPADPQTHFARAAVYEKTFETDDLEIALHEYETAAALAPNNYLLWLSLGSTYGRVGDNVRAEAAFRRAKELAPNYSQVNWALGNFLLREGNDDEGYAELRKAVSGDPKYAASAASTALQFSDDDFDLAHSRLAGISSFEVAFSLLLADQKELNKALEVWNRIEPQAKDDKYLEAYSRLRSLLIDQKRFTDAIRFDGAGERNRSRRSRDRKDLKSGV
jgi:tetratricopeptide (TPR) repeat protein